MRILTRYILREVTSHALLGGALFTFIIFTRDLGKILEFVVRDSASYSDVARIIAYTLPNALVVTIPATVSADPLHGASWDELGILRTQIDMAGGNVVQGEAVRFAPRT